jgi:hypothetical protein
MVLFCLSLSIFQDGLGDGDVLFELCGSACGNHKLVVLASEQLVTVAEVGAQLVTDIFDFGNDGFEIVLRMEVHSLQSLRPRGHRHRSG